MNLENISQTAGFPVPEQHLAVATAALLAKQDGHSSAATN
jgi:hypothetical protein